MEARSEAEGNAGEAERLRPFTMVVCDDFEPASGYAFDQAVRLALRIPRSHLHVVHAVSSDTSESETNRLAGLLRLYIEEKCAADAYSGQSVGIHVRRGEPVRELTQLATDVAADLILVGARTHLHLLELFHGSLAARLRRHAACPVLVVEPKPDVVEQHEPVIEPPCPDCLTVRSRSAGAQWWCARHAEHRRRAHHYSYQSELPFASHDSAVLPTGTGR
jgi:nucleotide-binding universal stress UspA family protein